MTPGLIWVNPRFVHLDKSTNLEEASKRVGALGISKGLQISEPPVVQRDAFLGVNINESIINCLSCLFVGQELFQDTENI